MKALVTGGCGFIGSHLCDHLLRNKHEVVVLDDLSTGSLSNLACIDELTLINANILDEEARRESLQGVDVVFHLAAKTSVIESVKHPMETIAANATGTALVATDAVKAGVKRFVLASSAAVYGNQNKPMVDESMTPRPMSPYASSKLAAEAYLCSFSSCSPMDTVSMRFFNVYGPRQQPWSPYAGVIPRFALRLFKGHPPIILGDGEQTRDFIHVSDVVRVLVAAATKESFFSGQCYNVGTGDSISIRELTKVMSTILGVHVEPVFHEGNKEEVKYSRANISRVSLEVGLVPLMTLELGLKDTMSWISSTQG